MIPAQTGILSEETRLARFLVFSLLDETDLQGCLQELASEVDGHLSVAGLGASVVKAVGGDVPGLRTFPADSGRGIDIPSTPGALWLWLRGVDRGELFHRTRELESLLLPVFELSDSLDCFQYEKNRDLTGYEDGTENPKNEDAVNAAIVQGQGEGLDGSSFVAVQQWLHDFVSFSAMTTEEQDNTIGRRRIDNEELDDAPESAHVKRTAQEDFDPEAFVLRRSMPWAEGADGGLNFVAFGKSFDAFEALLDNMLGKNDGTTDALFNFTRPITGAYYWCPPMKDEKLDLRALGI